MPDRGEFRCRHDASLGLAALLGMKRLRPRGGTLVRKGHQRFEGMAEIGS